MIALLAVSSCSPLEVSMTDSMESAKSAGSTGLLVAGWVETDRVHSKVYTDPAIFEGEIGRIFHNGVEPFIVCNEPLTAFESSQRWRCS
jgi:hypothetical protein